MQQNRMKRSMLPTGTVARGQVFVRRLLAPITVAFGLGLTVIWVSLLGYLLVVLLEDAL